MSRKSQHEEIQPSFGSSFTFKSFTNKQTSDLPYWHHHPEFEIVFVSNGTGNRQIGGHITSYEDGDLIFLGPNLPHLGFAQEVQEEHVEIVVQMKENFLGKDIYTKPEFYAISELFERARAGIVFGPHTKWIVGQRLMHMREMDNFSKLLELLMVLQILAYAKDFTPLNINHLSVEVKPQDQQRMREIYHFVEQHFHRKFKQDEVADIVRMSTSAFCRFFKKQTHKRFIDFLNEFRVNHACRMLSEEGKTISEVCFACGFNNLSHFNKQFRSIVGITPSAFRRNLSKFVNSPVKEMESAD